VLRGSFDRSGDGCRHAFLVGRSLVLTGEGERDRGDL
jgi:hypothetical protein